MLQFNSQVQNQYASLYTKSKNIENGLQNENDNKRPSLLFVRSTSAMEHVASYEEVWLAEVTTIVKEHLDNSKFKISDLAYEMAISTRQFTRRLKKITGLTPNKFIREIKLQRARHLLENKIKATVAEVAYDVGFDKVDYLSKIYKARFGKRPSAYLYA